MKHGGDDEEGAQAQSVHPGRDPFPVVVGQAVQQRHAHEGRHDEELRRPEQTTGYWNAPGGSGKAEVDGG